MNPRLPQPLSRRPPAAPLRLLHASISHPSHRTPSADLYFKTGKLRESMSCRENALRIYAKPVPGTTAEQIARGVMEISTIYEAVNEPEEALKLLQKALKLLEEALGQWSIVAGIEAQMGVMYYMLGAYAESRNSFGNAVAKLRASGELKAILEQECGLYHQDTLGVYSNLTTTYDALGR
ncbi:hypothetical protein J5N97_011365 [Dioscorea zingiberensis]|uniref:Tetratricopeptide repeat protein n=1 Tax=Dioscorea zingiberensis TaxID=325984 RepID=A0A9D5D2Y0_9LILI|nr:hypothetical protein J5N97_011365 [Dioscorea zingiberensis]